MTTDGTEAAVAAAGGNRRQVLALVFSAFVSGLCSIIYELLIATTASYFLGDSIKFFSLTIGIYMAAMGLGTFLSRYIERHMLGRFVIIELALAALGGLSIPILYFAYAWTELFFHAYLVLTVGIGVLIGLEIPFLTRLMDRYNPLKINIASILSFDYLGALIATIAFPFFLLPVFGIYQSSLLFGFANVSIGFVMLRVFGEEIGKPARAMLALSVAVTVFLGGMIALSHAFLEKWDQSLYEDRIVHAEQTRYQRIVLTRDRDDLRLYLDGNLQFSSVDEYRYHEALVHIPLGLSPRPPRRVLLLGAGDGLAARELLKHQAIAEIVLVDLDPAVVALARGNAGIRELNGGSLDSPRVQVVIGDAFEYLRENSEPFDLVIADLPDPNNSGLARLYAKQFYQLVHRSLAPGGLFVTQATSPYFSPRAFWSIEATVRAGGFERTYPYHLNVPSFGEWGFVLASDVALDLDKPRLAVATRYLEADDIPKHFQFDKDTIVANAGVSTLDRPTILDDYLAGWQYYR
ncbi:polyamine aminopropyltransferase [Devosia sp. LjRoot16]|uniref:polyamine aminopropyltransferase n=1 Tax=Devosia sp. LjRoot16 TaxID=3342271 RepID=UPI003ED124BD